MGRNARRVVEAQSGALDRSLELVNKALKHSPKIIDRTPPHQAGK